MTCICFQNMNHLPSQVSGKKTKVFVCSRCGMIYIYISTVQLPLLVKAISPVVMIHKAQPRYFGNNIGLTIMRQQCYTQACLAKTEHYYLTSLAMSAKNRRQQKFRILYLVCASENRANVVCSHSIHSPGVSLDRSVVHLLKAVFSERLNKQREKGWGISAGKTGKG